ncbi:MAG TPA: hypothetical protein VMR33_07050 [Candidatus Baltobacteraceae bacterium]|nr:hypothetical protein [Candidatus Baltobacteraceae bacterium]
MLYAAWDEHRFTSAEVEPLLAHLQLHLALNDVNPFVLVSVHVARPSGVVHFQNAHCATGVLSRHLAINDRAAVLKSLIEPVFSCANAETRKHLFTLHFLFSFQVLDSFVDGFNQLARPGEVLLQNLPMRLEGGDFFEIGPAQDLFNLLQLEPQLPVKQDLLESQELWLLVEPVAIRPEIGRLQQARFIIKMKRAHTDARHRGHLFDCISHRFFPAEATMATATALHSRLSRNVRVKGYFYGGNTMWAAWPIHRKNRAFSIIDHEEAKTRTKKDRSTSVDRPATRLCN